MLWGVVEGVRRETYSQENQDHERMLLEVMMDDVMSRFGHAVRVPEYTGRTVPMPTAAVVSANARHPIGVSNEQAVAGDRFPRQQPSH